MIDLDRGAELVRYAQAMHRNGWVANHDGNLSVRIAEDRFLISPTATSKGDLTLDSLVLVDAEGKVVSGSRKAFSELPIHLACYRVRPDARAVVHAHPPYASAFACAGEDLPAVFIPEAVVSLGARVPTAGFALPYGEEGAAPVASAIGEADACLLAAHGALAVGNCLEQAFLRLELVEHLARVSWLARGLGGVRSLPPDAVADLLERRRRAGLGPGATTAGAADRPPSLPAGATLPTAPAGGARSFEDVAPAPSVWTTGGRADATCGVVYGTSPDPGPAPASPPPGGEDLGDLVRREVERVLRGH